MSNFTLMNGQSIWVERVTSGSGYWDSGVYHNGEEVITYDQLQGNFVEPMSKDELEILPEGLSSKSARWLLTDHVLNVASESPDDASYPDKVYLSDPEVGKKKTAWVVFDRETWDEEENFEMLDTDSYDYVIVREDKLK
ncbi:head-closure protein [Vibrio phage 1.161.O._10N.261.48.C5]|nr:head-closure protein [Vibrio phage 1.161.O._10N.261.48.C5]